MPEVSIIIITKDRQELVKHAVVSVLNSLKPSADAEILVVDETDRPLRHDWPDSVRYLTIPVCHRGFGYARQVGLESAKGDLVACVDDDAVVALNWAEEIFRPFRDPGVAAVGGAVLPMLGGITAAGRAASLLGFPAGGLERFLKAGGADQESALISTCNCAFRAAIGRRVGGFDAQLRWGGEDQEFFGRISAGHKTLFAPNAIVYHRQRGSLRSAISWFYRRGNADFFLKCKHAHPIRALVCPLRTNFAAKLAAAFTLLATAALHGPAACFAVLATAGCAVGVRQLLGHRRWKSLLGRYAGATDAASIYRHLTAGGISWSLPFIKICLDLGFEAGRYSGFCRFLFSRYADPVMMPPRGMPVSEMSRCEQSGKKVTRLPNGEGAERST